MGCPGGISCQGMEINLYRSRGMCWEHSIPLVALTIRCSIEMSLDFSTKVKNDILKGMSREREINNHTSAPLAYCTALKSVSTQVVSFGDCDIHISRQARVSNSPLGWLWLQKQGPCTNLWSQNYHKTPSPTFISLWQAHLSFYASSDPRSSHWPPR